MSVQKWVEYQVTCDIAGCTDLSGYEETPAYTRTVKTMYKVWRDLGWKYDGRNWICPKHAKDNNLE